ncbi:MAG: citrate lyase acyl carrier protein [Brevinema sp.]
MIGVAGNEKDDARITVDLSYKKGITIEIISKMKNLFEGQVVALITETLNELAIKNAKVVYEDFGGLDFVIRARIKSAVRKAKEVL